MDLVLRNGTIVDGTGQPAFKGDVLIKDGRIAAVGTVEETGEREIDVEGATIAPGFIDVHTHFDAQAFW
ncbi:MAG: D-aminoacylase, partial [Alphaproteobacteria bacterium]|nr:D-aminoacylase [Alphaproteobacteria bacterium]